MFPHFHASRTRRTVWKDLEIMEANENKPKVSGFYCIDQLNLLKYCGFKVNGSKEKPIFASTIDQCMADIRLRLAYPASSVSVRPGETTARRVTFATITL